MVFPKFWFSKTMFLHVDECLYFLAHMIQWSSFHLPQCTSAWRNVQCTWDWECECVLISNASFYKMASNFPYSHWFHKPFPIPCFKLSCLPSTKGILQSQNEAHPTSNDQDRVHTPVSLFFLFQSFISPIWAFVQCPNLSWVQ